MKRKPPPGPPLFPGADDPVFDEPYGQITREPHTLARPGHPSTSHEAARAIQAKLDERHREALEAVARFPDRTAQELRALTGTLDSRQIGRRLPELREAGWVEVSGSRKCSITGSRAMTWRATKQPTDTLARIVLANTSGAES